MKSAMVIVWILVLLSILMPTTQSDAASAYLVADHASGHVLLSKNADEPRAVASLTKIAAVLVVLEWLDETKAEPATSVSVTSASLAGGANPLALKEGDELPIESALFAATMASDNTSIHAVAEALGRAMAPGTAAGEGAAVFVLRMNALADRLGMTSTRFVNPHGLDAPGESGISTAADIARLALHAHDHPAFGRYCAERERSVFFLREGQKVEVTLSNTNELVGSRGIDGTKTGTTRLAGACLVATTVRESSAGEVAGPRRLVVVVLDSPERFREAVLLLNEGGKIGETWLRDGGRVGNDCLRKPTN